MPVQNHLWELVKKLESKEVDRFLRTHDPALARRGSEPEEATKDYVLLFKDLVAVEWYDEKEFKKAQAGKPYLANLPQMKRYLYDAILDFLREPKKGSNKEVQPEFMIREWLEEATILQKRLLYPQYIARLEKAEEEARRREFLELLLEILKRKRTHINEATGKHYRQVFPKVLEEIRMVSAEIALNGCLITYRDTFVFAAKLKLKPKDSEYRMARATAEEFKRFVLPENARIESKINYYTATAMLAYWENQAEVAWESYKHVYKLWHSALDFQAPRRGQYLKMLNNYLSTGIAVKQEVEFFEIIAELNRTAGLSPDDAAEGKQNAVYLQLQYYMAFGDWENCAALEAEYLRGDPWTRTKMKKLRRIAFNLSFARFHFVFGRTDQAKTYIEKIVQEEDSKGIPDRNAEARVLEFLMAWDMAMKTGNGDAENLLHNIKSYLKRNHFETVFYATLLRSMAVILKAVPSQKNKSYQDAEVAVRKHLNILSLDSSSKLIIAWLRSKASDSPIYELL